MSRRGHFKKSRKPSTVILRLDEWPKEDRALWERARGGGDVLEASGRARNWASKTISNVEYSYGHWLKWLRDCQPDLLAAGAIERVTRENVRLYITEMQKRLAPCTVQMHLQRLGQITTAWTETGEFRWLFHAANRLRPRSVRNKRAKMRTPYELAQLGFRLMREAETMEALWHAHRSLKFRNGLIIALLAYRPVRLTNLADIVIDRHLVRTNDGFELIYDAHETKQRALLEFSLPKSLVAPMERYLTEHRPAILKLGSHAGTAGSRLWVSRDGGYLSAQTISDYIKAKTKTAFGTSINPHLFRDCAATAIAIDDPENARIIAPILGHSSMSTSELHYNQARTADAAEKYHVVLARARRRHFSTLLDRGI